MDWINNSSSIITIVILVSLHLLTGLSTSAFSEGVFVSRYSTGRNLLQIPKACPMSFEFQNYTIITRQCEGPKYPQKQCCDAFLQFACPFAQYLNNFSDCSKSMFTYITLKGHYPAGLFANECKGDQEGLSCPAPPPSPPADLSGSLVICKPSPASVIATLIVLLMRFI